MPLRDPLLAIHTVYLYTVYEYVRVRTVPLRDADVGSLVARERQPGCLSEEERAVSEYY